MCQMFRTQVEKSTDLHNEMRQQLKGIEEQTESTNESHRKLQIRVVDIEQRIGVMQKQIDSNYEEQTKLKEEQTELKEEQTRLKEEQTELKEEQTRLKEEVNAVKDENKPHKPSKEGKLFH